MCSWVASHAELSKVIKVRENQLRVSEAKGSCGSISRAKQKGKEVVEFVFGLGLKPSCWSIVKNISLSSTWKQQYASASRVKNLKFFWSPSISSSDKRSSHSCESKKVSLSITQALPRNCQCLKSLRVHNMLSVKGVKLHNLLSEQWWNSLGTLPLPSLQR